MEKDILISIETFAYKDHPSATLWTHRCPPPYSTAKPPATTTNEKGGVTSRNSSSSPNRNASIRMQSKRAVLKSGDLNIRISSFASRQHVYLDSFYSAMINARWRWTMVYFSASFFLSWLAFAVIWWIILYFHGDLEPEHMPDFQEDVGWNPCVQKIYSFTSVYLFSVEIQTTIGYGSRNLTLECPEAIFVMCIQSIFGAMLQSIMVGILFAKIVRPKMITHSILFSKVAIIGLRDGALNLMFRVGDLRKSNIIGVTVSALLIRTAKSFSSLPDIQNDYESITELELVSDGCKGDIMLNWPVTMIHQINHTSPFFKMNASEMLQHSFEIIVILEGTLESTGQAVYARTSYTSNEILWGYKFRPILLFNREIQGYVVDYSKFDSKTRIDTPLCSAKELMEF